MGTTQAVNRPGRRTSWAAICAPPQRAAAGSVWRPYSKQPSLLRSPAKKRMSSTRLKPSASAQQQGHGDVWLVSRGEAGAHALTQGRLRTLVHACKL